MRYTDVLACSFEQWYPKYKKHTVRSVVLNLPQSFVDYLMADGLVLPEGSFTRLVGEPNDDQSDDEDSVDWDQAEEETPSAAVVPAFVELDAQIKEAIAKLGGSVFPKLNWSSPKDAAWISLNSSLKCASPSDVYLLLKSSDFVMHDLTKPFGHCENEDYPSIKYQLVLRKWVDVNPGCEYRCFVQYGHLIGISQRDTSQYYPHICQEEHDIVNDIESFYHEIVEDNFPLQSYVFDVVRERKDKVRLLDFNPMGPATDALLFEWNDLLHNTLIEANIDYGEPEFRFIRNDAGVQPNPFRQYCVPRDFLDLQSGEDPLKLIDLINLGKQPESDASQESDGEVSELSDF